MEELNTTNSGIQKMELEEKAVNQLLETTKWTRFLSIAGFVGMGLFMVFTIVFAAIFSDKAQQEDLFITLLIPILVCGIVYFPIYYLYQFSEFSRFALLNADTSLLTRSIIYLRRHYKLMGIYLIIYILLFIMIMIMNLV